MVAIRGILMAFSFFLLFILADASLDFCLVEDKEEFQHTKDSHAWFKNFDASWVKKDGDPLPYF